MCPECNQVVPLIEDVGGDFRCGHERCGAKLRKCQNFTDDPICNRCLLLDNPSVKTHCDYCRVTTVIPDLSVAGNHGKWQKLEKAKHRVLFVLDLIGLEFRSSDDGRSPVLSFEFKEDGAEAVHTGHFEGCITVNIREADDVERERIRVNFQEPQRTLVGHIRHELGHYFWERLVQGQREEEFRARFGDERNPTYSEALERYHADGPLADWQENFVSAYATMHPWEDFAETFGAYLDMVTVLDTARHFEVVNSDLPDIDRMISDYQRVGLIANEFNRDMGLVDLVPEVVVPAVAKKLQFIHSLVTRTEL